MVKYIPHKYQEIATKLIVDKGSCLLLLDMGLGKTASTLAAIYQLRYDYFEVDKVLVIAPLRVASNTWPREIDKWDFSKEISYSIVIGSEPQRLLALQRKADVYIINRENTEWISNYYGAEWPFKMVVIDESSSFKNPSSKRFKSLRKIMPFTKIVVGLTGTPIPNGLLDLWSQMCLIDAGQRLGRTLTSYRSKYFTPRQSNGHIVYNYEALPGAEEKIYQAISDISVSMRAVDWLDMPELITENVVVRLSNEELKLYKKLEKEKILEVGGQKIEAVTAAVLTNKLLQLSNGAVYDDNGDSMIIHNRKIEALIELVEALNGKTAIIAYWYRQDFERIRLELSSRGYSTSAINNEEDIDNWNNAKIQILLLHPASAGHGLNLQHGGSRIIWYGPIWNLELYQQFNARLYRQGQTAKSVFIWRLVAKDTYDEKVLPRLEGKKLKQEELIEALRDKLEEEETKN